MEFGLAPASTSVTASLIGISALLLGLASIFLWYAWAASHAQVTLQDDTLHLHVPLYGRQIPLSAIDIARAAIVDIDARSPLRPRMRTNGIGLPGYGVGWFRLADGSRALMAATRRSNMLYLPTHDGYVLLLSLTEPSELLEQLQASGRG